MASNNLNENTPARQKKYIKLSLLNPFGDRLIQLNSRERAGLGGNDDHEKVIVKKFEKLQLKVQAVSIRGNEAASRLYEPFVWNIKNAYLILPDDTEDSSDDESYIPVTGGAAVFLQQAAAASSLAAAASQLSSTSSVRQGQANTFKSNSNMNKVTCSNGEAPPSYNECIALDNSSGPPKVSLTQRMPPLMRERIETSKDKEQANLVNMTTPNRIQLPRIQNHQPVFALSEILDFPNFDPKEEVYPPPMPIKSIISVQQLALHHEHYDIDVELDRKDLEKCPPCMAIVLGSGPFKKTYVKHSPDEFVTVCQCKNCLEYRKVVMKYVVLQLTETKMLQIFLKVFTNYFDGMLNSPAALNEYDRLINSDKKTYWLTCGVFHNVDYTRLRVYDPRNVSNNVSMVLFSSLLMIANPCLFLQILATRMETIVKSYAAGYKLLLAEPSNRDRDEAEIMLDFIVDGYEDFLKISEQTNHLLLAFEKNLLNKLKLPWQVFCKRIYQHYVFTKFEDRLLTNFIELTDKPLTDKSIQLIKKFLFIDDEMKSIEKIWPAVWMELNQFVLCGAEYERRSNMADIYQIFKSLAEDALNIPEVNNMFACTEPEDLEIVLNSFHETDDENMKWYYTLHFLAKKWKCYCYKPPNAVICDDKCVNCGVLLPYHFEICECITCSVAGYPIPPKKFEMRLCDTCYGGYELKDGDENDLSDSKLSKIQMLIKTIEDASPTNHPAEIPVYHIAWAIFKHLPGRKRYTYKTLDRKYFCSYCENIECLVAKKILLNTLEPAITLLLIMNYMPLDVRETELSRIASNLRLFLKNFVVYKLEVSHKKTIYKIFWIFIISLFAETFMELKEEDYDVCRLFKYLLVTKGDIRVMYKNLNTNKTDNRFFDFLQFLNSPPYGEYFDVAVDAGFGEDMMAKALENGYPKALANDKNDRDMMTTQRTQPNPFLLHHVANEHRKHHDNYMHKQKTYPPQSIASCQPPGQAFVPGSFHPTGMGAPMFGGPPPMQLPMMRPNTLLKMTPNHHFTNIPPNQSTLIPFAAQPPVSTGLVTSASSIRRKQRIMEHVKMQQQHHYQSDLEYFEAQHNKHHEIMLKSQREFEKNYGHEVEAEKDEDEESAKLPNSNATFSLSNPSAGLLQRPFALDPRPAEETQPPKTTSTVASQTSADLQKQALSKLTKTTDVSINIEPTKVPPKQTESQQVSPVPAKNQSSQAAAPNSVGESASNTASTGTVTQKTDSSAATVATTAVAATTAPIVTPPASQNAAPSTTPAAPAADTQNKRNAKTKKCKNCFEHPELAEHCINGHCSKKRVKKDCSHNRVNETRDRLRKKLKLKNDVAGAGGDGGEAGNDISEPSSSKDNVHSDNPIKSTTDSPASPTITSESSGSQTQSKCNSPSELKQIPSNTESSTSLSISENQTMNPDETKDETADAKKKKQKQSKSPTPAGNEKALTSACHEAAGQESEQQSSLSKKALKRAKQKEKKEEGKRIAELCSLRSQYEVIYFKEFIQKMNLKTEKANKKKDKKKVAILEGTIKNLQRSKANIEKNILELIATVKQTNREFKFSYLPTKEQQQEKLEELNQESGLDLDKLAGSMTKLTLQHGDDSNNQSRRGSNQTPTNQKLEKDDQTKDNNGAPQTDEVNPNEVVVDDQQYAYPMQMGFIGKPIYRPMCYPGQQPQTVPSQQVVTEEVIDDNGAAGGDPSKRIVTIRRVNMPNANEPQVTVTAKGPSPDKDKLLYTFVNGQMVPTTSAAAAENMKNGVQYYEFSQMTPMPGMTPQMAPMPIHMPVPTGGLMPMPMPMPIPMQMRYAPPHLISAHPILVPTPHHPQQVPVSMYPTFEPMTMHPNHYDPNQQHHEQLQPQQQQQQQQETNNNSSKNNNSNNGSGSTNKKKNKKNKKKSKQNIENEDDNEVNQEEVDSDQESNDAIRKSLQAQVASSRNLEELIAAASAAAAAAEEKLRQEQEKQMMLQKEKEKQDQLLKQNTKKSKQQQQQKQNNNQKQSKEKGKQEQQTQQQQQQKQKQIETNNQKTCDSGISSGSASSSKQNKKNQKTLACKTEESNQTSQTGTIATSTSTSDQNEGSKKTANEAKATKPTSTTSSPVLTTNPTPTSISTATTSSATATLAEVPTETSEKTKKPKVIDQGQFDNNPYKALHMNQSDTEYESSRPTTPETEPETESMPEPVKVQPKKVEAPVKSQSSKKTKQQQQQQQQQQSQAQQKNINQNQKSQNIKEQTHSVNNKNKFNENNSHRNTNTNTNNSNNHTNNSGNRKGDISRPQAGGAKASVGKSNKATETKPRTSDQATNTQSQTLSRQRPANTSASNYRYEEELMLPKRPQSVYFADNMQCQNQSMRHSYNNSSSTYYKNNEYYDDYNGNSGHGSGGNKRGSKANNKRNTNHQSKQQQQQQQQYYASNNDYEDPVAAPNISSSSVYYNKSKDAKAFYDQAYYDNERLTRDMQKMHIANSAKAQATVPADNQNDKSSVAGGYSIMDQLKCGVQVEDLSLPPGITLTKVDPAKSEQLRQKSESIKKLAQPLQTHHQPLEPGETIFAPSMHSYYSAPTPYATIAANAGTANIIRMDQSNGVIMVEANPPKILRSTSMDSTATSSSSKSSKNKKKRNKAKNAVGNTATAMPQVAKVVAGNPNPMPNVKASNPPEASNAPKMITLRNPMFHGPDAARILQQNQQQAQRSMTNAQTTVLNSGTTPQMEQQAAIIKNENGIYTIRNPALHHAVTNGLVPGGFPNLSNVSYYTPQEAAAEAARANAAKNKDTSQPVTTPAKVEEPFSYFSTPISPKPSCTDTAAGSNNVNNISISCTSINTGNLSSGHNFNNNSDFGTDLVTPLKRTLSAIGSEVKHAQRQKTPTVVKESTWSNFGLDLGDTCVYRSGNMAAKSTEPKEDFENISSLQEQYRKSSYYNGFDNFPKSSLGSVASTGCRSGLGAGSLFDNDCHIPHSCGDDSPPPVITGYNSYLEGIPNTGVIRYDDASFLKTLIPGQRLTNEVSIHNVNESNFNRSTAAPAANSSLAHHVEISPIFPTTSSTTTANVSQQPTPYRENDLFKQNYTTKSNETNNINNSRKNNDNKCNMRNCSDSEFDFDPSKNVEMLLDCLPSSETAAANNKQCHANDCHHCCASSTPFKANTNQTSCQKHQLQQQLQYQHSHHHAHQCCLHNALMSTNCSGSHNNRLNCCSLPKISTSSCSNLTSGCGRACNFDLNNSLNDSGRFSMGNSGNASLCSMSSSGNSSGIERSLSDSLTNTPRGKSTLIIDDPVAETGECLDTFIKKMNSLNISTAAIGDQPEPAINNNLCTNAFTNKAKKSAGGDTNIAIEKSSGFEPAGDTTANALRTYEGPDTHKTPNDWWQL